MPKPHYAQVSLEATPYYHCYSRCVRRAFLCGLDRFTKTNYEHRKQWLVNRIYTVSTAFALDLYTYAIMSNHLHVVAHVNKPRQMIWGMDEIINRWHMLYNANVLSQRYLKGRPLGKAELSTLSEKTEVWREQLINISWFMHFVNEGIAQQANAEYSCTERFWGRFLRLQNRHTIHPAYKGRFSSQVLLDEAALVACMANNINMGGFKSSTSRHSQNTGNIRSHPYKKANSMYFKY